jgi:hypothetical protein
MPGRLSLVGLVAQLEQKIWVCGAHLELGVLARRPRALLWGVFRQQGSHGHDRHGPRDLAAGKAKERRFALLQLRPGEHRAAQGDASVCIGPNFKGERRSGLHVRQHQKVAQLTSFDARARLPGEGQPSPVEQAQKPADCRQVWWRS